MTSPPGGVGTAPSSSLRRRFIAATVGVYLATALGAALVLRPVLDSVVHELGVKFATQRVLLEKARVEGLVEREVALARALVTSPAVVAFCRNEDDPTARAQGLAALSALREIYRDKTTFLAIDSSKHFYFHDATTLAPVLSYTVDENKAADSWYPTTMREAGGHHLNLDRDVVLDTAKIWINTVVRDGDRKVGIGGTGLDLTDFTRTLIKASDDEVSVVVADTRGVLQAHRDHHLLELNAKADALGTARATVFDLVTSAPDRERLRLALDSLRTQGGVATLTLPIEGRRRLVAAAYIPELKWFDLVLVDTAAVVGRGRFAPLLLGAVAFALALTIGMGMLVDRWVLSRLARLMASTLDVASGRHGAQIDVDRDDELGALTRAFNHMSSTVEEHTLGLERKVSERTAAVQASNEELARTNKLLRDSIAYAKLIQDSILPRDVDRSRLEMAVLWAPRDIVSGDFYVVHELPGALAIGVFDCTGHGVPGAFMTMTANAALSAVLESMAAAPPDQLVAALHRRVRAALHQESKGEIDSGLDGALCVAEHAGHTLRFVGAKISLFVAHDGEVTETKPDRHGIGYARLAEGRPYTCHEVQLPPGATCYLTTDGLLDEPNDAGAPFGKRRFVELLRGVSTRSPDEQRAEIEAALARHRGGRAQRDDITVVIFRLPGSGAPAAPS